MLQPSRFSVDPGRIISYTSGADKIKIAEHCAAAGGKIKQTGIRDALWLILCLYREHSLEIPGKTPREPKIKIDWIKNTSIYGDITIIVSLQHEQVDSEDEAIDKSVYVEKIYSPGNIEPVSVIPLFIAGDWIYSILAYRRTLISTLKDNQDNPMEELQQNICID